MTTIYKPPSFFSNPSSFFLKNRKTKRKFWFRSRFYLRNTGAVVEFSPSPCTYFIIRKMSRKFFLFEFDTSIRKKINPFSCVIMSKRKAATPFLKTKEKNPFFFICVCVCIDRITFCLALRYDSLKTKESSLLFTFFFKKKKTCARAHMKMAVVGEVVIKQHTNDFGCVWDEFRKWGATGRRQKVSCFSKKKKKNFRLCIIR